MKNNFKVGQIAYIVLSQKRLIVPVKIVEQIIKRTEDNEHVDWNIQLPDDDQFILLSELKDNIYSHIDDAHNQLLTQAKKSIDKMINTCLELQEKTWPQPKNLPEKNLNSYILVPKLFLLNDNEFESSAQGNGKPMSDLSKYGKLNSEIIKKYYSHVKY